MLSVSTLLYASDSWTIYSQHIKALEGFYIHCLQKILDLTWHDCVPLLRLCTTVLHVVWMHFSLRDSFSGSDTLFRCQPIVYLKLSCMASYKMGAATLVVPRNATMIIWSLLSRNPISQFVMQKKNVEGVQNFEEERTRSCEEWHARHLWQDQAQCHHFCDQCSKRCQVRISLLSHQYFQEHQKEWSGRNWLIDGVGNIYLEGPP